MAAGHIMQGEVDERSIVQVQPDDLKTFVRVHMFAGIAVWDYALRSAGWADDREVWTGSCPCQPFSAAGKRGGIADERHLWPEFFRLISERRPHVVFGEQVASPDGLTWLDAVSSDMEGAGYAFGAVDTCAAGFGAPHIRQRLYFVGDALDTRLQGHAGHGGDAPRRSESAGPTATPSASVLVADAMLAGRPERRPVAGSGQTAGSGCASVLVNAASEQVGLPGRARQPRSTNGRWADVEWLPCQDGKSRPAQPGTQQMVDGSAESLGRLCPDTIRQVEEEVSDAIGREADAGEALHDLWETLAAQAVDKRDAGGLRGVHAPAVLLAFLRQLTQQGWAFAECLSGTGAETPEEPVRVLRGDESAARPPRQRGLDGLPAVEHPDAVRVLSSVLARHAQAAWGEAFAENARNTFPLITGATQRVGRLRAYGNALCAPQAEGFIEAYMAVAS